MLRLATFVRGFAVGVVDPCRPRDGPLRSGREGEGMDRRQVLTTYDEAYARAYEEKFILNEHYRSKSEFEISVLKRLLRRRQSLVGRRVRHRLLPEPFSGRVAGRDWTFLRRCSRLRENRTQTRSCSEKATSPTNFRNGKAHGPSSRVSGIRMASSNPSPPCATVVGNLARWTADDGVCFVPVFEPANLGRGVKVPYLLRQAGLSSRDAHDH